MFKIKYHSQIRFGAAFAFFNMLIGIFINILTTPFILRILGQNEFGLYSFVASIIAYLGIFNFGFGSSYIKFYSRYKFNNDILSIKKLNGLYLIVFLFLAIFVFFLGILVSNNIELFLGNKLTNIEVNKAKFLVIIMAFNLGISFIDIVFNSFLRANENNIQIQFFELIKLISNPFFIMPMLLFGFGSIGLATSIAIINTIIFILHIFYTITYKGFDYELHSIPKDLFKEVIVFSSFVFFVMLIDQINWNLDKILLGRIIGPASVAIYAIATQFNIYYIRISNVISNVFIPKVHQISIQNENLYQLSLLMAKVGRIQFILLMLFLSGFIIFGESFITWWAGSSYKESYYVTLILLTSITIDVIQNIGIEIQRSLNKQKFRAIIYTVMALINIIITIPLIHFMGPIGAAIGTALSLIIGNGIIMNFYYSKIIGLNIRYFWKEILKIFPSLSIPMIFGYILINYINMESIYIYSIFILLYIVVYSLSMWFLGLNDFEKTLFSKLLITFK